MMSNPVSKFFMAAVFIYLLTISAVWADRILIDDPEQTVTVSNSYSCYRPVDITVDTITPALYEADSAQLQKLTDSVKAMLSYECPGLSSIMLTGLIRGLDEIVYQGEASKNNNWLVRPLATAAQNSVSDNLAPVFSDKEHQDEASSTQFGVAKRYDDELKQGQLEITGLHLGMSVDQVTSSIVDTFAIEPHYDAEKGFMTMDSGGCASDLSVAASEDYGNSQPKCLQAWFSDNRVARLQRLTLFQIVDGQINQVNDLLVNKYGTPLQTHSTKDNSETQMVWRAINPQTNQSVIEEVDATIKSIDSDRVVTNITLYNTQVESEESYADLDLKL